jgi:predicted ABC-class ATPase
MQRSVVASFRQGLRELGYAEDRNIVIEFRSADGKYERLRELADGLLRLARWACRSSRTRRAGRTISRACSRDWRATGSAA